MSISVKRTGGLLGARIDDVDFSQALTPQILDTIADALYTHQVVCIPALEMTADQHVQIGRHFGELEHNATDQFQRDADQPYMTVIDSDKGDRADSWHADETFLEHPPLVNLLHGKVIPDCGGDTAFISAACAYEALSPKIKALLEGLTAMHDYGHLYELGWRNGVPIAQLVGDALVKGLLHSHPIVRPHRVTGRPWLTVNPTYTRFIEGLTPLEADAILAMLLRHMQKPEFGFRHHWQVGDLLIWDQQAVQHYAVRDFSGRRLVHRISALATTATYKGVRSAV
jgi:taurine dioxygenase